MRHGYIGNKVKVDELLTSFHSRKKRGKKKKNQMKFITFFCELKNFPFSQ